MSRGRFGWLAALIGVHRWLGIAGGLLFIAWFASGIVMIYARMPAATPQERLLHAETLDLSALEVSPHEAAAKAGLTNVSAVRLSMLRGRPLYYFPGPATKSVFADNGESLTGLSEAEALELARRWAPERAATPRYETLLTQPDQWTLQSRQHMPLHRIALGDPRDTRLYVSSRSGEVVMETTRRERLWAYAGPVLHWLYLPVLRRNGPAWTRVILWCSGLGCVLCVSGLASGLLRLSRSGSPYDGLMKWHHFLGLAFGVVTFTWTFSGLLSMGPWSWLSNGEVTREQRMALSGAPAPLEAITTERIRAAESVIARSFAARQMTLIHFRGEPFWLSEDCLRSGLLLVPALRPESGSFRRFTNEALEAAAHEAMPGVAVQDAVWLDSYDAYYYDRRGARPLPVLRVRYADAQRTWLYLDPQRGSIARIATTGGRLNRWLYHGLHSLDFPRLYERRPLWDIVVIGLSIGGLALAATTLSPGWKRLRDHARSLVRR